LPEIEISLPRHCINQRVFAATIEANMYDGFIT